MTWCSKRRLTLVSVMTLCAGLWAPLSLAQTSPTSTFDEKTVDIFDSTEGNGFSPLDIIHQANFSREDPFSFFQRQQENLNTEFLDFRSRQLEQLRNQGYQPPSLAVDESEASETIAPGLNPAETAPETLLRIDLGEESSLTPALENRETLEEEAGN
ncbi:MAG: hypothetical protein ACO3EZ_06150 [Prochlorotrichaceae cyanobacterium]